LDFLQRREVEAHTDQVGVQDFVEDGDCGVRWSADIPCEVLGTFESV
jgi:hypothetical protein